MDDRMGDNINGPSLIKVPDWIENPLGQYYLYFAHHQGTHIRLAYADRLEGPWTTHAPGTLQLEDNHQSKFGTSVKVDAQEYCINCKLCEHRCPDFAIFVNYNQNSVSHE